MGGTYSVVYDQRKILLKIENKRHKTSFKIYQVYADILVSQFIVMEDLGIVSTHRFDKFLVLGFSEKWLGVFEDPPKFKITIEDDGKLHLISTKSVYKK
ncbi:MAG: hypothetical protein IS860_11350 [Nitrosopumilus sp.]|nr:hypothetical protein [Nitrosopumilus sp.]